MMNNDATNQVSAISSDTVCVCIDCEHEYEGVLNAECPKCGGIVMTQDDKELSEIAIMDKYLAQGINY
jgi:hypothetical protein